MRPSLLTWLCTSLSAGFALVLWSFLALLPNLVLQALLTPFLRLRILVVVGSFSRSLTTFSLKLAGSRSATLSLATVLLSAPGRASKNRDFIASHLLGHLCFSWHVWSRCSFLRDHDLFLKLRHVGEFPGCPHFIWDISCVELERLISAAFLTVITRSFVRLSIGVWFLRLYHNLVGDRIDPNSYFDFFALCWRNRAFKFALSRSCCSL